MGMLIKNEFYKLKREWFMAFLLLLSLLPILTGGAGAVFNNSTKSLADLFFFMNNQFSMFFPMVIFILIGSLFYQEYKNKTYINWITYGFSKKKLFLSKVAVSIVIGIVLAAILFITFCVLVNLCDTIIREIKTTACTPKKAPVKTPLWYVCTHSIICNKIVISTASLSYCLISYVL